MSTKIETAPRVGGTFYHRILGVGQVVTATSVKVFGSTAIIRYVTAEGFTGSTTKRVK